ncbi:MAG: adenosylcobinamide-GDP ribazoletransferase [Propionibacteriaceae bacterium]
MAFSDAVRLAVGTLTILPAGAVRELDRRTAGTAMVLAPVAVVPLAVAAAAAGYLARLVGLPTLICGLLVVAVLALGTRALHLDGLADTVDGLGSGWDRAKALAVMRRGDVGPMGVVTLVLVLVAQAVAAGALLGGASGAVLLALLICCSRASLTLVCRRGVPAARPDGLGSAVAGTVPTGAAVLSWLLVGALLASVAEWHGEAWWIGLASGAVSALVVILLVRHCVHRFGGVTGDVMGAAVEVALTVLLVLAAR